MNAAGHTGVNASSRLHRGRGHYLNPRKNHLAAKYIATSAMTAAPAIQHHMKNSFAFSPRSRCSSKSRLLTSAPTVVATNSVAPHSRANAGHRGSVVDQL